MELHHQELQTNTSYNEQPKVMLPVTNESNHSAAVRPSSDKDIETSIITKNIRGNDVTKSISETLLKWRTLMCLRHLCTVSI